MTPRSPLSRGSGGRFFDRMEGKTKKASDENRENSLGKNKRSTIEQERGYSAPLGLGRCGRRKDVTSNVRRTGDALAPGGEEGRGRLRKAAGRRERPMIRGCPNGATHRTEGAVSVLTEANPPN